MSNIRPFGGRIDFPGRNIEHFYDLVDNFFNSNFTPAKALMSSSFKVDIEELTDKYIVEAELPGYSKEEIKVSLNDGQLKIEARHEESLDKSDSDRNFIHKERKMNAVSRSMYFDNIDSESLKAVLTDGVLQIEVPKQSKTASAKNIEIE